MSTYTERAAIMQRADLTPLARLLALRIVDMQGLSKGACLLTTDTLADELGVSRRQILRASADLRTAGLLVSSQRSARRRIVVSALSSGDTHVTTPGDTDVTSVPTPGDTEVTSLVTSTTPPGVTGVTSVVTLTSPREREAREKNERVSERLAGGSATPPAAPLVLVPLEAPPKPAPLARPKSRKEPAPTSAVWAAYAEAYDRRYGVPPSRNKRVNGQLSQLVARLGAEEAAAVAAFYVGHNDRWYVTKCHDTGSLLRDAESLRMQWATDRKVTRGDADESGRRDEMRARARRVEALLGDAE